MSDNLRAAIEALRQAQPEHDFLLISTAISRKRYLELAQLITGGKRHARCGVFLCTFGGDSDAGFRMGRSLQQHYEHIHLVIPSYCKSAGTLMAIGAHELAIGDLGELGPLDLQIMKPKELQERGSVQDLPEALDAIEFHVRDAFLKNLLSIRRNRRLSTKLAGNLAAKVAAGIAAPFYSQIDPLQLGEIQRATRVVLEYGSRLNDTSQALKSGALERLAGDYPSHHFVIDRKEAGELFRRVRCLSKEELTICQMLDHLFAQPAEQAPSFLGSDLIASGGNYADTN